MQSLTVVLWHLNVQYRFVGSRGAEGQPPDWAQLQIGPLTVDCDITNFLTVEPGSISAQCSYSSKDVEYSEGAPLPNIYTVTGSGQSQSCDITFGRCVTTCDENLYVTDPDSQGQGTNDFCLSLTVNIPVSSTATIGDNAPETNTLSLPVQLPVTICDYDYTQPTNSATLNPPPPPSYSRTLSSLTYTLTAKDLQLQYTPQNQDLRQSWGNYTSGKELNVNLARDDVAHNWFLHANSYMVALVEGAYATNLFVLWRQARTWDAPIANDGTTVLPYATAAGWTNDNLSQLPSNWFDCPGYPALTGVGPQGAVDDASLWPKKRRIDEFVSTVDQFPEFGLLYYTVVYDVFPNAARVRAFNAVSISATQWCAIKNTSEPYTNENYTQTCLDSGWFDSLGNPRAAPY